MVRTHRHEAGLTQQELATKAGISVAALRDIEQSRRCRPRVSTLTALSSALGLNAAQTANLIRTGRDPAAWRSGTASATLASSAIGAGQGLWLAALGPLEAWGDGRSLALGPPARRAVLGLLVMDAGTQVRRDTIIDVLWGESPPSTAIGLVQAHVSRLRASLESWKRSAADGGVIVSVRGAYRLCLSEAKTDLQMFRGLAARAAAAWADNDARTSCDFYEQAIGLWRADPLADVDMLRSYPGVTLLRQELGGVLLRYADVAISLGQYRRVLPRLQALAAAAPLDEPVHARLMIALAGSGQQAAAVHAYEEMRFRLDRELGLYPGEELTEAHVRVLRQDIPAGDRARARGGEPALTASAPVVPRQLPAAPRYLSGRQAELDALSSLLDPEIGTASGMVIAALTGMAGIGKTAVALHWAHQAARLFPDGQLFVNLRGFSFSGTPLGPTEAICGFLTALGVPATQIPADTAGQAALYRTLLAGRRMLIVLDNALDAEQVRSLLPGSAGCMVLVTSRNRLTGLAAAEGAHLLMLGVLTEPESRDLLAMNLGAERAQAEPAAVSELIGLCACLPLALCDVTARVAAHPGLPLARLAAEMRDEQGRLDALETGEPATSVRMVFSWSRARLSKPASRMFRLIGIHAGPDITVPAAASLAGLPRNMAYLALAELCDENLLAENAPGRYTCHELLRTYAAERSCIRDSKSERRAAVHRLLDHYLHGSNAAATRLYFHYIPLARDQTMAGVLPEEINSREQAARWFKNERHVLLAVVERAAREGYTPHAWELPWAAGPFFHSKVYWHKLAAAQESALAIAEKLCDPAGQTMARHHLGLLKLWLGEHASASHHLDEAAELARKFGDRRLQATVGLARARRGEGLRPPRSAPATESAR
jgi:DNA-binding SARP family transcriptional activator/DNA-binding XRE family transcriptional regulator